MSIDEQLFLFLNHALSGPVLTPIFATVTRLGNALVLAAMILPLMFFLDRRRFRVHAVAMILSVAISGGAVNLLKIAVDRPRPVEHFKNSGAAIVSEEKSVDRSFPSGHTQTVFGAAVYLSCLYPVAAPFLIAAALLVGLSRIALGAHFPLDVLAGAVIGGAFSMAGFYLATKAFERRKPSLRESGSS